MDVLIFVGSSAAFIHSLTIPTHHAHSIDHDLITVGETPFTHDASELAAYVLPRNRELNMVFHFELMDIDSPPEFPLLKKPWTLAELKAVIGRWQRFMRDEGFWNA